MKHHYWAVTENLEMEFVAPTARQSLDEAMKFAGNCVALGVKVTILRNGNIVWVG